MVAKSGYRAVSSLEVFYTGGPVVAFPDGSHIACACADEVKVGSCLAGGIGAPAGAGLRVLRGASEPGSEPSNAWIFTPADCGPGQRRSGSHPARGEIWGGVDGGAPTGVPCDAAATPGLAVLGGVPAAMHGPSMLCPRPCHPRTRSQSRRWP